MDNLDINQPLPIAEPEVSRSKKILRITAVAVVILALGAAAYFFAGNLKGSFLGDNPSLQNLKIDIESAVMTPEGDLKLAYSLTNLGETDIKKELSMASAVYINSATTAAFAKPFTADNTVSFRAGEKVTYQMTVPRSLFPKETYATSTDRDAPPSVGAVKTVQIKLFGLSGNASEEITSTPPLLLK